MATRQRIRKSCIVNIVDPQSDPKSLTTPPGVRPEPGPGTNWAFAERMLIGSRAECGRWLELLGARLAQPASKSGTKPQGEGAQPASKNGTKPQGEG
jgi:hypothetical protein